MYVVFDEISVHSRGSRKGLYVLCRFWDTRQSFDNGDRAVHRNDFILEGLNENETFVRARIVDRKAHRTDTDEWLTKEEFLALAPDFPPVEQETFTVSVREQIMQQVEGYWRRYEARGRKGPEDNASPERWDRRPDDEDTRGLLKTTVKTLVEPPRSRNWRRTGL